MKILIMLLALVACGPTPTPPASTPEPTTTPIEYKGKWNNPDYDQFLITAIKERGPNLLTTKPSDYEDFIKDWPTTEANLLNFWFKVIVEMAYYESGWKTTTQYKENFKDQKGNYIISRGLLQLSIESSRGYKCPFSTEQDIHNPKLNLECGVMILNKWVGQDVRIAGKVDGGWKGGARYWSVLREEIGENKKSTQAIKRVNF